MATGSPERMGETEGSPHSPLPPLPLPWDAVWDNDAEHALYCQEMYDASEAFDFIEG